MREIQIDTSLAVALEAVRRVSNYSGSAARPQRIESIEAAEAKLGCRIPDPILAYYASGLAGRFSTPFSSPLAMVELTKSLRDIHDEERQRGFPWDLGSRPGRRVRRGQCQFSRFPRSRVPKVGEHSLPRP